jgi:hypothetical protein
MKLSDEEEVVGFVWSASLADATAGERLLDSLLALVADLSRGKVLCRHQTQCSPHDQGTRLL